MNIDNVLSSIDKAIDAARKPVQKIAGMMIYATAVQRPGLSRIKISSEVISENGALGILTGDMPDGTENVVNKFVNNMTEKIVDSLKEDAKVECVIPIGSIVVTANGANAGGPVEAVGTNINMASGVGVIR